MKGRRMNLTVLAGSAVIALSLAFSATVAFTQDVAYQYQDAPVVYAPGQAELDQLLAPVALYPDVLLGNMLAASTYPLEVIALHRWLEANPSLSGSALERALAGQPWDASVKALAPFRDAVAMMNREIDWMQRVGDAFLADPAGVMDTVQGLRRKAYEAGNLRDNERERVVADGDVIAIEPVRPEVVYVPMYDPRVVYGPWWWPGVPYAWSTYYWGPYDAFYDGIAFGIGVTLWSGWHAYDTHPDWRGRHLVAHPQRSPRVWNHNPAHRFGVPYADNRQHDRYRPRDRGPAQARQDYRGFDVRPGVQPPTRTAPRPANPIARATPPAQTPQRTAQPHALQPAPNPVARQQSARGHESLAARPGGNPIARAPDGGTRR